MDIFLVFFWTLNILCFSFAFFFIPNSFALVVCEIFLYMMSDPNFVRGLSFADILILVSRIMILSASYRAKQGITQCFHQEYKRIPKVFFWIFLDPSSPRLASGSPGPSNNFMAEKLDRLGELQLAWAS